jgi:hypothetical protein
MTKEKIDKYYEEKQKEMGNENKNEVKTINKSLEHREELKFIQSLDKSRSKRNIIPIYNSINNSGENNWNNIYSRNEARSYNNKNNMKRINTKEDNLYNIDKNSKMSHKYIKANNNKKENNYNDEITKRNKADKRK